MKFRLENFGVMLFVLLLIERKSSYFVHGTGQVMRSLV